MISNFLRNVSSKFSSQTGLKQACLGLALVSGGYFLGTMDAIQLPVLSAQGPKTPELDDEELTVDISNDALRQIQAINESLTSTMEVLKLEGKYNAATEGVNPYLVLIGGGDAIDDLERGFGVDPVTFSQLYAGRAVREVLDQLSRDEHGRLLYKNRLVRIYSPERLQKHQRLAQMILEKRAAPQ